MPTIKTAVDVAASPEVVWRVLTDFSRYPSWNPFLREVHGRLAPGARLKVRLRLPHGRAYRFSPRLVKVIPAAELRWRGKLLIEGVFDGEHAFIIVPRGITGCTFIQREHFSGLLAPVLVPIVAEKTRLGFDLMNLALKKIAEARH